MREILFRGKREDGIWFEGSLHKYTIQKPLKTETRYRIQEFNFGYSDENEFECDYMSGFDEEVIPKTVGQFTGLYDVNGKKIYEGDIVKDIYGRIESCYYNQVRYCLIFQGVNYIRELVFACESEYEVIGNIHDNPELLEEKENERD